VYYQGSKDNLGRDLYMDGLAVLGTLLLDFFFLKIVFVVVIIIWEARGLVFPVKTLLMVYVTVNLIAQLPWKRK
jgi:uncharacterized membrane protein YqjE